MCERYNRFRVCAKSPSKRSVYDIRSTLWVKLEREKNIYRQKLRATHEYLRHTSNEHGALCGMFKEFYIFHKSFFFCLTSNMIHSLRLDHIVLAWPSTTDAPCIIISEFKVETRLSISHVVYWSEDRLVIDWMNKNFSWLRVTLTRWRRLKFELCCSVDWYAMQASSGR